MSTKDTSQTQQKAAAPRADGKQIDPVNDPFGAMATGMEAWGKLAQDGMQRVQSFYDELATFEAASYERAKAAGTQWAELVTDTVSYMAQMTAEWRTITLEATRRSGELLSPRA
jgi:hypothetical protein